MKYRYDVINHLIAIYGFQSYLEIGVLNGDTIRAVQCKTKDGVDSEKRTSEVNYHMTSDEFFKLHSDKTYDIIFIDGMHDAAYVCRDLNNALERLNTSGRIVLHDCFPLSSDIATKRHIWKNEDKSGTWCGDGFKVIHSVVKNYSNDLVCNVIDIDCGVGIVRKKSDKLVRIEYDEQYTWAEMFLNPLETIHLIQPDEFLRLELI